MLERIRKTWHLRASRGMALAVLMVFCASIVPLPTGAQRLSKVGSDPFPCQSSLCGCRTAEQCWTSCCCRSPAQRLAWARQNGIAPPAYAQKFLQPVADKRAASRGIAKLDAAPVTKPCCTKAASSVQPAKIRLACGVWSNQCQGKSALFLCVPWALASLQKKLPLANASIDGRSPLRFAFPRDITYAPPVPPPRTLPAFV